MKLSIVSTLYQSAPYLQEFHARSSAAARALAGDDYEIVLVNDGSPDNSLDVAVALVAEDPHLVVVDLSRNFGHHKAMMTGLAQARGEWVYLIDSDLEEEPEWLEQFAGQMADADADVVYGIQKKRKGGWFERCSGAWFYRAFRLFTGLKLPENAVTARLMTRRYVDALLLHRESEVFIAGLWHITGFSQVPVAVAKHSTSATTYSLARKATLLINSVTSFSNAPLTAIFYLGATLSALSLAYIAYLVVHWLLLSQPVSGWTSVMASIWLLGGMIISFIGLVGIYLSRIFMETKRRPYTIVRQVHAQRKE